MFTFNEETGFVYEFDHLAVYISFKYVGQHLWEGSWAFDNSKLKKEYVLLIFKSRLQ